MASRIGIALVASVASVGLLGCSDGSERPASAIATKPASVSSSLQPPTAVDLIDAALQEQRMRERIARQVADGQARAAQSRALEARAYMSKFTASNQHVSDALVELSDVSADVDLRSPVWLDRLQSALNDLQSVINEAKALTPPAEFVRWNTQYLEAMTDFQAVIDDYYATLKDLGNPAPLADARQRLGLAKTILTKVKSEMDLSSLVDPSEATDGEQSSSILN